MAVEVSNDNDDDLVVGFQDMHGSRGAMNHKNHVICGENVTLNYSESFVLFLM